MNVNTLVGSLAALADRMSQSAAQLGAAVARDSDGAPPPSTRARTPILAAQQSDDAPEDVHAVAFKAVDPRLRQISCTISPWSSAIGLRGGATTPFAWAHFEGRGNC